MYVQCHVYMCASNGAPAHGPALIPQRDAQEQQHRDVHTVKIDGREAKERHDGVVVVVACDEWWGGEIRWWQGIHPRSEHRHLQQPLHEPLCIRELDRYSAMHVESGGVPQHAKQDVEQI